MIGISCYTSADLINWKYEGEPCFIMPAAFPPLMIPSPGILTILSSVILHVHQSYSKAVSATAHAYDFVDDKLL